MIISSPILFISENERIPSSSFSSKTLSSVANNMSLIRQDARSKSTCHFTEIEKVLTTFRRDENFVSFAYDFQSEKHEWDAMGSVKAAQGSEFLRVSNFNTPVSMEQR